MTAAPPAPAAPPIADDGWCYHPNWVTEGDARKLVTLLQGGMVWVGIRAFHHKNSYWMNNNEPEAATVLAWRDLLQPATKRWIRGILT